MCKKVRDFFKTPPIAFIAVVYILALLAIVGSIVIVIKIGGKYDWAYAVFAIAAILLCYAIYLTAICSKSIRRKIVAFLKKNSFFKKFLENWEYRASVAVIFSFVINIFYALFEGIMGIVAKSIWYAALAIYYVCLCILRFVVIKNNDVFRKDKFLSTKKWKTYRFTGIVLVVLSCALTAAVVQMVVENKHPQYIGLTIFAVAFYAFYKFISAVINIKRAKKYDDPILQSTKNIALADAFVTILSLQTAMIASFSDGTMGIVPNAVTGGCVCFAIVAMGIYMIINSTKKLKTAKQTEYAYEQAENTEREISQDGNSEK